MTTTHSRLASGTEQRVCVTCDQPIELAPGSQTNYVHVLTVNGEHAADHVAQPKLAHAMDADPFAGLDANAEPVFPPADPEPSMSLETFQKRVANGAWATAGAPFAFPKTAAYIEATNAAIARFAETADISVDDATTRTQQLAQTRNGSLVHAANYLTEVTHLEQAKATPPLTEADLDAIATYSGAYMRQHGWTGGRCVHGGQITYRTPRDPRPRTRRTRATTGR